MNVTNKTPVSFARIDSNQTQKGSPTTITAIDRSNSQNHSTETIEQVPTASVLKSILKPTTSYDDSGKITKGSNRAVQFSDYSETNEGEEVPTKPPSIGIANSNETANPNLVLRDRGGRSRSYSSSNPEPYDPTFSEQKNSESRIDNAIDQAAAKASEFASKSASQFVGGVKKIIRNVAQAASDGSQVVNKYVGEPLVGIVKDIDKGEKSIEEIFLSGKEK
ncbi:MAG: hypothetical protein ACOYK6_05885 [Chthoniobacterales bacterium]